MQAKTFLLFSTALVASLGACWPSQAAAVGGDLPTAQSAAKAMAHLSVKTAADFVRLHPEKAEQLFKALDWSHPGLKDAARAHARGDLEATAVEVAAYFRRSSHGAWLREAEYRHGPGGYEDAIALADKVLADEYRFQSVSGPVARLGNGRIDWDDLGPRQDREWQFFLNRHFHLVPLLKAWQQTGDGRYAHRIEQDLQDWILYAGPPAEAESDKALPGRWQPMSSASRLLQVWPQTFYNLQTETSLSDGTRLLMLWSVPQQVNHLRRYHRRKHNHAIKEMISLSHAGAAWPEFADAAEWRAYSQNVLEQELDFQIYPTGVQKELSAHYHLSVLNYFVDYVSFMRAAGFAAPPSFESRIEAMAGYVANAMRPDGGLPLNNNGDENNVRTRLMDLAAMFDRDDWRYLATNGSEGSLAGRQLSTFDRYAGQLISKSGAHRDAEYAFFDIGPWGISHQHNDKLNVTYAENGIELLVDTGRYVYAENPFRDYVRSTAGHNLLLIDGKGQNPQVPESLEPITGATMIGDDFAIALGTFNDGFESISGTAVHHRAAVHLHGRGLLVVDWIETDRPRKITHHWQVGPKIADLRIAKSAIVQSEAGSAVKFQLTPLLEAARPQIAKGEEAPVRGWYSPDYNIRLPINTIIYETGIAQSRIMAWHVDGEVRQSRRDTGFSIRKVDHGNGVIELTSSSPNPKIIRLDLKQRKFDVSAQ